MTNGLLVALLAAWTTFALAALVPGPNVICVTSSALLGGRMRGLRAAAGLAVATGLWALSGALGLGAVLEARPDLLPWLRVAGAAILAWLGISMLRETGAAAGEAGREEAGGFAHGLVTGCANPLNAFFWASLASVVLQVGPKSRELVLYAVSCALLALLIYGAVALAVASLPERPSGRAAGAARVLCGGAFIFLGGMLAGG